jgi:hypothetical protein
MSPQFYPLFSHLFNYISSSHYFLQFITISYSPSFCNLNWTIYTSFSKLCIVLVTPCSLLRTQVTIASVFRVEETREIRGFHCSCDNKYGGKGYAAVYQINGRHIPEGHSLRHNYSEVMLIR